MVLQAVSTALPASNTTIVIALYRFHSYMIFLEMLFSFLRIMAQQTQLIIFHLLRYGGCTSYSHIYRSSLRLELLTQVTMLRFHLGLYFISFVTDLINFLLFVCFFF